MALGLIGRKISLVLVLVQIPNIIWFIPQQLHYFKFGTYKDAQFKKLISNVVVRKVCKLDFYNGLVTGVLMNIFYDVYMDMFLPIFAVSAIAFYYVDRKYNPFGIDRN